MKFAKPLEKMKEDEIRYWAGLLADKPLMGFSDCRYNYARKAARECYETTGKDWGTILKEEGR